MKLHERVRVGRDVDFTPHTTLRAGERGTVVGLLDDRPGCNAVEVEMDKYHHGLVEWGNVCHLGEPDLDALHVIAKCPRPWVVCVASFLIGCMMPGPITFAQAGAYVEEAYAVTTPVVLADVEAAFVSVLAIW